MTKKPTRRDILKMSGSSVSVTGFASGRASPSAAATTTSQTNLSPEARTKSSLFRLINNSRGRGQTAVRLRHPPTGHLVKTFNLDTTGTNHPEMVDRPHKERFPTRCCGCQLLRQHPGWRIRSRSPAPRINRKNIRVRR